MRPQEAFEMGYRSAASGFFFDGMEIIAALAPGAGGVDNLRGAFELLFPERDRVNDNMRWLADLCTAAYGKVVEPPAGVDGYRTLLQDGVFDIVNRWSFIADIKQVSQLQAWFYAGFGLGRAETVMLATQLMVRLRDLVQHAEPLPSMPTRLQRMAAEGAQQMVTASGEDDLIAVRPLFEDVAGRLRRLAVALQRSLADVEWDDTYAESLVAARETARKVRIDFQTSD